MLNENINTCLGVELKLLTDVTFSCRFCLLTREKNHLNIRSTKVIEGSLAEVLAQLPKAFSVSLCISGKGTLHKVSNSETGVSDQKVVENAFPGLEINDFYYQVNSYESTSFVSIIRKSLTDSLVQTLNHSGLKIFSVTIGPAVTAHVWSQLNLYGNEICIDGHDFHFKEDKTFLSYNYKVGVKNPYPVKIGEQVIAEEILVAYAAAFQLLLHDKIIEVKANVDSINVLFKQYIEHHKLKRLGLLFMFGIFVLLLISFLTFSYYNTENVALAAKAGRNTANVDNTELQKKHIAENKYLIKQLGWNGGYNYGFILNEIGSLMPNRLVLKSLVMNDFKTDLEKQTAEPNIKITGTTDNLSAVNNWIFILREKPWVKKVKLSQYQQDAESEHCRFNIILSY